MRFRALGCLALAASSAWCLSSCGQDSSQSQSEREESESADSRPESNDSKDPSKEPSKGNKSEGSADNSPEEDDGESGSDSPDEENPSAIFDLGEIPEGKSQLPDGKDAVCDVDFLFVVDNSGSMRDEQINLANSVPKFIKTIQSEIKNLESYHVGIISTDIDHMGAQQGSHKNCSELGGLKVQRPRVKGDKVEPGGKAGMNVNCGPYANGLSFMTRKDKMEESFDCAARLGTQGDGNERPMDALFASMEPKMTAKGACNEGFFRKKSILAVVLITDEEDDQRQGPMGSTGSKGDPATWHKKLMQFKDNRQELVVVLSLIGHDKPNACKETIPTGQADQMGVDGAEISPRLKKFTELFGKRGSVYDVCAPDYAASFSKAVNVLGKACNDLPPPI